MNNIPYLPHGPNITQVIDDPASDNLLLVMEYVEGESLHPKRIDASHWDWVPEPEAWRRARDVLQVGSGTFCL